MECPTCYSQRRIKRGTVQDADGVHPCTDSFHDKGSKQDKDIGIEKRSLTQDEKEVAADFEAAQPKKRRRSKT